MATKELSIKLLINKKTGKLCFAEAGSDVVEFLTALLSLPLGTITSLLAKEGMVGSVGTLLGSAETLGAKYNTEELQLIPAAAPATVSSLQQLLGVKLNGSGTLYTCLGNAAATKCGQLSALYCSLCPSCRSYRRKAMTLAGDETNRPVVSAPTYTVKDDLSVTPASMSMITLLAQCDVKDLSVLQEKIVKIGKDEALGILSAAFKSKTVLTDVFMPKKSARGKRGAPEEALTKKNARCKTEPPEEVIDI
ncbi:uncharacterized protein LOC124664656 [Lolium rigidum]|uniref:uncharacterized protein LOC124664656 n=1 Tax=Lolium rigidum TaxID=89674 RepID=UPI001F5D4722|nr:uncharacterized protein LOC124664656 [Lolium rigidum]